MEHFEAKALDDEAVTKVAAAKQQAALMEGPTPAIYRRTAHGQHAVELKTSSSRTLNNNNFSSAFFLHKVVSVYNYFKNTGITVLCTVHAATTHYNVWYTFNLGINKYSKRIEKVVEGLCRPIAR